MTTEAEFDAAATKIQTLKKLSNPELLELYGLFKQARAGDVNGKRPGMLDVKGRAKFDAWAGRKGTSPEQARADYVALVDRLVAKHG